VPPGDPDNLAGGRPGFGNGALRPREIEVTMSGPLSPQTRDDTFLMKGTVTSAAVEAIGTRP
jgi:hypothetical protein